jgi:molybdopterin-guanine dinucleotide biosynthesis protein B
MRIIGLAGRTGSGNNHAGHQSDSGAGRRGFKIATVKHAHHEFDTDGPGKDSRLHRRTGASEVAAVSSRRRSIVHKPSAESEPPQSETTRSEA